MQHLVRSVLSSVLFSLAAVAQDADRVLPPSGDLVVRGVASFSNLDGGPEDLDGVADGTLSLHTLQVNPTGTILIDVARARFAVTTLVDLLQGGTIRTPAQAAPARGPTVVFETAYFRMLPYSWIVAEGTDVGGRVGICALQVELQNYSLVSVPGVTSGGTVGVSAGQEVSLHGRVEANGARGGSVTVTACGVGQFAIRLEDLCVVEAKGLANVGGRINFDARRGGVRIQTPVSAQGVGGDGTINVRVAGPVRVNLNQTRPTAVIQRIEPDPTACACSFGVRVTLDPPGNQTVGLGGVARLTAMAVDSRGITIPVSVGPLPLPTHMSFDQLSGRFEFTPDPQQVRTFEVVFSASAEGETAEERVQLQVTQRAPGSGTIVTGRVLESETSNPIVGAPVSVLGGTPIVTDAQGGFRLDNVAANTEWVQVEGFRAPPAGTWATVAEDMAMLLGHELYPDQVNVVRLPIYLPRLGAAVGTIDPSVTTILTNPIGVQVTVSAQSARNANGTFYNGPIYMPIVARERTPAALPADLQPGVVIAIQPAGLTFNPPARITWPNFDRLEPNTEANIWSINPDNGRFDTVGVMRVSGDGSQLTTVTGGVRASSWHFPSPGPGDGTGDTDDSNDDNDDPQMCPVPSGSSSSPQSGNLQVSHKLLSYSSLGEERGLELFYNSNSVNPKPILNGDIFTPSNTAVPLAFSSNLTVAGITQGLEVFTQATRTPSRVAYQFDASAHPTGWYPTELKLWSNYQQSRIASMVMGGTLIQNDTNSCFGAGWTLGGLQRLHFDPNSNRTALVEGTGAIRRFVPQDRGQANASTDICFALDASGSIGSANFRVQLDGVASAVEDPSVVPHNGSVSIGVVTFPGGIRVNLTRIDSLATAQQVATQIRAIPYTGGGTPMDQGINDSVTVLAPSIAQRQVICLATDGFPNDPTATLAAADRAFRLGIDEMDAIGIGSNIDLEFLRRLVRNGIVEQVSTFQQFAATVGLKIRRVIGGSPPGEFSILFKNSDGTYTRETTDKQKFEFLASGFLRRHVDRNGNATDYTYDTSGRVATIVDPVGKVTTFNYGANLLQSIAHPDGTLTRFTHSAAGCLTQITDPDGASRRFDYNARGKLICQFDKRGFETRYEYSAQERFSRSLHVASNVARSLVPSQSRAVVSRSTSLTNPAPAVLSSSVVSEFTDGEGRVHTYRTNRLGLPVSYRDPLLRTTAYTRDAAGLPTRIVNARGVISTFTYDVRNGQVTRQQDAVGTSVARSRTFTYHPDFNFVQTEVDCGGNTTRYNYDPANGNLLSVVDALGGTRSFTYDARGLVATSTDQNGNVTRYTYDAEGRLATTTDALGFVTRYVRDARGNVIRVTEGDGTPQARTRTYTYDSLNRVLTSTDGAGGVTRFAYDGEGHLTRTTLPTGEAIAREYDGMGRLSRLVDPLRGATTFTYDGTGNLRTRTDALGRTTTYTYDAAGQLTRAVDALAGAEVYTYNPTGNVLTFENAARAVTTFGYDELDRRTSMTTPEGRVRRWAYDSRDNLTSETQPGNVVTTHAYDRLSRLLSTTVPAVGSVPGNLITHTYDAVGNLRTATDNDTSLEWTYDALNRTREQKTLAGGIQPVVTLTSTYDAVGNRIGLADSLGGAHGFTFDSAGRMVGARLPTNALISMTRDVSGRLTSIGYPNGIVGSLGYEAGTGRLASIVHQRSGQPPVLSLIYGLSAVGNISTIQEPSHTWNYGYDGLDRLLSATAPSGPESYTYDPVGNRVLSHLSNLHTLNRDNQLLEDQQFTYTYDPRGNLATKTQKPSGPTTTYVWDGQNQLVEVQVGGGATVRYRYDGLGRKVERNPGGGINTLEQYVHDGDQVAFRFVGTTLERLTYGDRIDQILASSVGTDSLYYHADHLGSIRALTRVDGSEEVAYQYDSYGQPRVVRGNGLVRNRVLYTGRESDLDTQLAYYRARWYDSRSGRVISEDPAGFRLADPWVFRNLYRYVGDNPVNRIDPSGLAPYTPEQCARLLENIRNIEQDIAKRERDLRDDPLGLPGKCDGDKQRPSLSRRGHQMLLDMQKANLARRQAEYLANCGGPPNGTPAPERSWLDWEYWEELTGLTGAALLAYLLVSEGSRIFPPRNLVPIW